MSEQKALTPPLTAVKGGKKETAQSEFKDFKSSTGAPTPSNATGVPLPVTPGKPAKVPDVIISNESPHDIDPDLVYILSQPRAHDSPSEKKFNLWVMEKARSYGYEPKILQEGLVYVEVGKPEESTTLFSCHMDTVHGFNEVEPQKLAFDPVLRHITVLDEPNPLAYGHPDYKYRPGPSCLGADDGAGVWVLLKMIEAKVPGGYFFHRGEERGCISSAAMARKEEKFMKSWTAAIAFDRPKDFEVITHQGGAKCASNEYAQALADALNADPTDSLDFKISDMGGTTDTRQYRKLVPECINIGVGYFGHHTKSEYIDYDHLVQLKNRCIVIDWNALPVTRDPNEKEVYSGGYNYQGNGGWRGGPGKNYSAPHTQPPVPPSTFPKSNVAKSVGAELPKQQFESSQSTLETLYNEAVNFETIMDWFEMDPELTARGLLQALVEGRATQIKYNMLLSKTLMYKEK